MAKVTDWHDLWEYAVEQGVADMGCLTEYERLPICAKCSSRRQETMDIRGKESGMVLAQRIVCKSCGVIVGEVDKRDILRAKLERGEIMVKDVLAVERDLG